MVQAHTQDGRAVVHNLTFDSNARLVRHSSLIDAVPSTGSTHSTTKPPLAVAAAAAAAGPLPCSFLPSGKVFDSQQSPTVTVTIARTLGPHGMEDHTLPNRLNLDDHHRRQAGRPGPADPRLDQDMNFIFVPLDPPVVRPFSSIHV